MANYGAQVLGFGLTTFILANEMFDPVPDIITGYSRNYNSEFFNSLAFNVATYPLITGLNLQGTSERMLCEFKWSLQMLAEEADQLELLIQAHRASIAAKDASPWLVLADGRVPFVEQTQTRPASGPVLPIANGVRYYANFKLVLTAWERRVFIPHYMDKITLEAKEVAL